MRTNRDGSDDADDAAPPTESGERSEPGGGSPPETESTSTDPGTGAEVRTESGGGRGGVGGRDVVVPIRLYKTVTVFSTLIAVVCVVLGFVLLDAATQAGGAIRVVLGAVLGVLGAGVTSGALTSFFQTLSPVLAALGLCSIGFGAGVYVLGTRFRARGMGNSQEDSDEGSDNG